ncbi:MAG TPA: L-lactate dehydrogenase [Edaphobacter sp.]|nr:L-lactate dehydrogenase [Edaphobacter sp.]
MPSHRTRISIIGCGHVGTSCAYALLLNHLADELILIDGTPDKARGEALDLQHAVPLGMPMKIVAGTYKDAAASAIVVITVGTPGKFAGSRLALLEGNVVLVRECIANLMAEHFDGVLLLATNPVDVLTYIAQTESGLPVGQVIGTGTLIDSERFRFILGANLNVDARSVHASIIGEHGDSSVAVWSAAQVAGIPLALYPGAHTLPSRDELQTSVRHAGPEVAELKGNTSYAIAACVARICEAILHDERSVLVVSTRMTGQYGLHDVSLSTACIVGNCGVVSVLELHLDAAEQKALEHSASVLRNAAAQVKAV